MAPTAVVERTWGESCKVSYVSGGHRRTFRVPIPAAAARAVRDAYRAQLHAWNDDSVPEAIKWARARSKPLGKLSVDDLRRVGLMCARREVEIE